MWLFSRIDIGAVCAAFASIPFFYWFAAFFLYLSSQIISSIRWFIIARTLGFGGEFLTYLKFYFVGMYFNLFLPSAIGGDVLKAFFLSRGGNGKLRASYSILCDRLFGLWAMFIIGAAAVILSPHLLPGKWCHLLLILAVSMTGCAISVPFFKRLANVMSTRMRPGWCISARFFPALEYMLVFWQRPASIFYALGLSLILQILCMTATYLLGHGLGIDLCYGFYLSVLPLIGVLTVLPISLSGLGIREGGFMFFFHMKAVPMEKALALSLCFFAVQAAAALIGGMGYMAGVHREVVEQR